MIAHPDYPLLTAEAFLQLGFGDLNAELDNSVIRKMAGGSARHVRVQGANQEAVGLPLPSIERLIPHEEIFARDWSHSSRR